MKKAFSPTLIFLILVLVTYTHEAVHAEAPQAIVKITDSKLHTINYGLDSLQHWVNKMASGDTRRAGKLLKDHQKLLTRFHRIPASQDEQYTYVNRRLNAVRSQIESKSGQPKPANRSSQPSASASDVPRPNGLDSVSGRLKLLEQDLPKYASATQRLRSRLRSDLESLRASFDRIPTSKHPDYLALRERLRAASSTIQPKGGPITLTDAQVASFVDEITQRYSTEVTLPEARKMMKTRELTAADVDMFIAMLKAFGEHADRDLPKLKQVVDATGQGAYWLKWLQTDAIAKLSKESEVIKEKVDRLIEFGINDVKNRSQLDVAKNNYAFNNEAIRKNVEETIGRTQRTIQQAVRLEKLLGKSASWSKKESELEGYVAAYRRKVRGASQTRSLPLEVGTADQHKIAQKVLMNKKYGVGKIVLQIVNSKIVPRDRIEHKGFNGKIETIVRQWEEYQVTTVEEENGKYFVYTNNLAKFSRAPRTTPINRWILKQRFKNGEISKAKLAVIRSSENASRNDQR